MIGQTLKKVRTIYGLKAVVMSSRLGISASYLSEIENDKKQPSLELLQKYADVFEMKLSSLILLSEKEKEDKGDNYIRDLMNRLIDHMSKNLPDGDNHVQ